MSVETALPFDQPPLRAAVEQSAKNWYLAAGGLEIDWDCNIDWQGREDALRAARRLLGDLTRGESRDFWVRWGILQEGSVTTQVPASPENDRRQDRIPARWLAMRDDAPALLSAVKELA